MHHVINTEALVAEGILHRHQAEVIRQRSREAMVALAINTILCTGIIAAALGFVFWLADPVAVAATGALFVAVGTVILLRSRAVFRMFGNAAGLIGAGMLLAGAAVELIDKLGASGAAPFLALLGAAIAVGSALAFLRGPQRLVFMAGAVLLIGGAMHLAGLFMLAEVWAGGWTVGAFVMLYAAAIIAATGTLVDVRAITALAIVPFAQILSTSTEYFHASYVFYSQEPTLSILQMAGLIGLCLWLARRFGDRIGRHSGMLAIMAMIVGNLCFLVGSLWGDVIGESWWEAAWHANHRGADWDVYRQAAEAFAARTLVIPAWGFAILWALVLVAGAIWAARNEQRGLFNAAMVFAAIHAYTQSFESFGDEPLAYVIGGLAAVPLAWGIWRLDARFRRP